MRHCLTMMLALFACTAFGIARPVLAQAVPAPSAASERLEATTRAVASELRCPVCQGLSINDSPSELAQEMKGVVRDRLAAGESPDEVKAYFVAKYGEWILLEPEARGFNLLVYLLPLGVVLGGLAAIVVALRRWIRPSADGDDDLDATLARQDAEDAADAADPAFR